MLMPCTRSRSLESAQNLPLHSSDLICQIRHDHIAGIGIRKRHTHSHTVVLSHISSNTPCPAWAQWAGGWCSDLVGRLRLVHRDALHDCLRRGRTHIHHRMSRHRGLCWLRVACADALERLHNGGIHLAEEVDKVG